MPSVFDNPNYLPLDVIMAIEEQTSNATPEKPEGTPESVENLVSRLLAIRERLFHLAAVFAISLSWDVAREGDRYKELFRDLADELRNQDPDALDRITQGYEALLFAEPTRKPSIPLAAQQMYELHCELRSERGQPPQPKPLGYVCDGLQSFV